MDPDREGPLRVLLVPDVPYWICATIARAYVQHNPEIDFEICSGRALRRLPRIQRFVGNFDVVHFLTPHDANKSIGDFSGRIATVTTIHHVQDETSTMSVGESDAVMTASTQWIEKLRDLGVPESKLVRVPYGVDTNRFRPPEGGERAARREGLGIAERAFVVGFVGKRSSDAGGRKGTEVFLRGVQQLANDGVAVHVLLVGPGWEGIVADFASKSIPCTYKPFVVEESEFAGLYHAMDAYWCTSLIEGGPIPVLEAMASGVCCLATEVGIVPDVMESGVNGFIVPFNDPKAFATHTMTLIGDPLQRQAMGATAAATIYQNLDWAQSARHLSTLYACALQKFSARETTKGDEGPVVFWPRNWVVREEAILCQRFHHDASHPPSTLRRAMRQLTENRWVQRMVARGVPGKDLV